MVVVLSFFHPRLPSPILRTDFPENRPPPTRRPQNRRGTGHRPQRTAPRLGQGKVHCAGHGQEGVQVVMGTQVGVGRGGSGKTARVSQWSISVVHTTVTLAAKATSPSGISPGDSQRVVMNGRREAPAQRVLCIVPLGPHRRSGSAKLLLIAPFGHFGLGGFGTRPWWLALLACGGAYWPLALEPSAMTGGGSRGGGGGTRPWWLALSACGGAYWPLALEPSAMTSRHPYCRGHPLWSWGGGVVQGGGDPPPTVVGLSNTTGGTI